MKCLGSAREKRLVLREQGFCMQMIPFSMQVLLLVSAVLLDIPLSVFTKAENSYFHRAMCAQDYSAVTAACLMTKKSVFEAVGGLSTELAVAFKILITA